MPGAMFFVVFDLSFAVLVKRFEFRVKEARYIRTAQFLETRCVWMRLIESAAM